MQPKIKETASGKPEAFFEGKTPDEITTLLSVACLQKGYMVDSIAGGNVRCSKPGSDGQQLLMAAMTGSGSNLTFYVNFVCIQEGSGTKVFAQGQKELQQSLGRKYVIPAGTNEDFNALQSWLDSLGGK
jgi:hypothetical protein